MTAHKITIIIACLNSGKTIERAIYSVIAQNYKSVEVVVVDGCSVDETVKLVESLREKIDIKIISEPDRGIGDAWNKGLRILSGDIIGILGSDDAYGENVFQKISEYFCLAEEPIIGFGDVVLINQDSSVRRTIIGKLRGKFWLLNGFGFLHPSVFFNRKALDTVGVFNPRIQVAIDTDWLLRAESLGVKMLKIPSLVYMQSGGVSDSYCYTGMGEYADALVRNGYSEFQMIIFFLFRFLGKLRRVIFNLGA